MFPLNNSNCLAEMLNSSQVTVNGTNNVQGCAVSAANERGAKNTCEGFGSVATFFNAACRCHLKLDLLST